MTIADVFSTIYRERHWSAGENPSGPGSTMGYSAMFRFGFEGWMAARFPGGKEFLVVDAGCGNFHWMAEVQFPKAAQYIGIDIVPEVIHENRRKAEGRDWIQFWCDDFTDPKFQFPDTDILLFRYVLQHLPEVLVRRALQNALQHTNYLMATTFPGTPPGECDAGGLYLYDLEAYIGPADEVIAENWDPMYPTQKIGVWYGR